MNNIDIKSNEYPYLLKQINDPPKKLYFKGNWDPEIFKNTLSVVGSRKMTRYGERITRHLIKAITLSPIPIVSGFMYGIDATAHETCVENNKKTIAVLPCGINKIHPPYHEDLYKQIQKTNGLIISEYPHETAPALWTYPKRNRIIAGLSSALLVVEAGIKSGALITANIAMKYNKRIFAVPGPLTSPVSLGTASLIQRGASIVTKADDILNHFGFNSLMICHSKNNVESTSRIQKNILQLLSRETMGIDQLTRTLGFASSEIGAELTLLLLRKLIVNEEGKYAISDD